MQNSFIWKTKERKDTSGECLIETRTQNIPYLSIVTQDKTKERKAYIDECKGCVY